MQWVALLTLALAPAIFIASLSVYADSCSDAIKPAIGCPSGYTMTCLKEGYDRYECTKLVDGVVVPIGTELPKEQHDTIEKSVMELGKASQRTISIIASTSTSKKTVVGKRAKIDLATSSVDDEKNSGNWKRHLSSWLHWVFSGTATSTRHIEKRVSATSTDKMLSNNFFANFFKRVFSW